MDRTRRIVLLATLLAAMFGVVAPASAATRAISIVDDEFDPKGLEVDATDVVVWTNDGSVDHTVTSDDGLFDSGALAPGESFSVDGQFSGTVRYHCVFHGGPDGEGMAGVLFVTDQPGAIVGGRDQATDDRLASTGGGGLPPGASSFFALTIVALGVYLSRFERIVYPERFR